jgi:hypothetical protein
MSTVDERVERVREFWLQHRGEWGAKSRAVHLLFGPDAPAAGTYWERTMEVIELLEWEVEEEDKGAEHGTETKVKA